MNTSNGLKKLLAIGALGVISATPMTAVYAQGNAPDSVPPANVMQDTPADSVIIESDQIEPSREEMVRRFHDQLKDPPIGERQIADGLEVKTRNGHFCRQAVHAGVQSSVGGDVTLLAPCLAY